MSLPDLCRNVSLDRFGVSFPVCKNPPHYTDQSHGTLVPGTLPLCTLYHCSIHYLLCTLHHCSIHCITALYTVSARRTSALAQNTVHFPTCLKLRCAAGYFTVFKYCNFVAFIVLLRHWITEYISIKDFFLSDCLWFLMTFHRFYWHRYFCICIQCLLIFTVFGQYSHTGIFSWLKFKL